MKKLMILAVLTVFSTSAFAQLEAGDLGVFFDASATTTVSDAPRFVTTNSFYLATGGNDLAGFESGLVIDPAVIILASLMTTGPGPINVGTAPTNWIVGAGGCVTAAPVMNLVTFTWGVFDALAADLLVCLAAATPSSFEPAAPGYLACDDSLIPFGVAANGGNDYPDGCGVIYPTGTAPVATDQASWGAVKAQY